MFHCGALYRIQACTLGSKQVRRFSGSRTLKNFRMYISSWQLGCNFPGYGFCIFVYNYYDPRESLPYIDLCTLIKLSFKNKLQFCKLCTGTVRLFALLNSGVLILKNYHLLFSATVYGMCFGLPVYLCEK